MSNIKVETLKDIPHLKRRLRDLNEEIKDFNGYSVTCLGKTKERSSSFPDGRMISIIERRDSLKKNMEQIYLKYLKSLEESLQVIESIEEVKIRNIFTARYVHEKTWNQVAQVIGGQATADSVKKIHDRYLKKVG